VRDLAVCAVGMELGGCRRAGFSGGWVEFRRVQDVESAVALLNGRQILGATRQGEFLNDLWGFWFVPGFAWDDLIEDVCRMRRERVLRVKSQVASARSKKDFVEKRTGSARAMLRENRSWRPRKRRMLR
jgi:hypothetical protein